jgi:hypothetical protein
MSCVDYPPDVGDYQLVGDEVLNAMKQFSVSARRRCEQRSSSVLLVERQLCAHRVPAEDCRLRPGAAGIPTIVMSVFFVGGVRLFLGILGEYIVAIFNQAGDVQLWSSANGSILTEFRDQATGVRTFRQAWSDPCCSSANASQVTTPASASLRRAI